MVDDDFAGLVQQEKVDHSIRGAFFALLVAIAFWVITGLIVWAVFAS